MWKQANIFICLIIIFAIIILLYFQPADTVSNKISHNYYLYNRSKTQWNDRITKEIESQSHLPDYHFLESDIIYIKTGTVDLKYILYLFIKYPDAQYLIWYKDDHYDPKRLLESVGDAFISLLYLSDEYKISDNFIMCQRSLFTMRILISSAFFQMNPLDILVNQIIVEEYKLSFYRTYFLYIFVDHITIPSRKFFIENALIDPAQLYLFQTWISSYTDTEHLYLSAASFKRDYPNYNYRLFDDFDMKKFIREFYSQHIVDCYDRILPSAFKSDFFRYLYLYKFGGFYFDITLISNESLVKHVNIEKYDFIVPIDLGTDNTTQLYQACMYVRKNHPYMQECIKKIVHYCNQKNPNVHCLAYTGPKMIGSVVSSHKKNYESRDLFLRHIDGDKVILKKQDQTHIIFYTRGHFKTAQVGVKMYTESQKTHYGKHCAAGSIFYN